VIGSFIRHALGVDRKKRNTVIRGRRRRKLPLSTFQWLILTFGIATVVGVIFVLTLYYQPGR